MVVVLDPMDRVAVRAPRTLFVADRRPDSWALHVCVCDDGGRSMHPKSMQPKCKPVRDACVARGRSLFRGGGM